MNVKFIPMTTQLMQYITDVSVDEAASLKACREFTSTMASVAIMQIPPIQGQFLQWLIQALGVKRVLELGTFTGYSALAMALALPEDGKIITCDINDEWTTVAKRFWKVAGVDNKIECRLGPAIDTLRKLNGEAPFDFVFIDADKRSYPDYLEACLLLVKTGGIIAIDNVLQEGEVANPDNHHSTIDLIREFNRKLHQDSRVSMTLLPIVDGLTLARKL